MSEKYSCNICKTVTWTSLWKGTLVCSSCLDQILNNNPTIYSKDGREFDYSGCEIIDHGGKNK